MVKNYRVRSNYTAIVAAAFLFFSGSALSNDPLASRVTLEESAGSRQVDPAVPVWPSVCNCFSVSFGAKNADGDTAVRFAIGIEGADRCGQASALPERNAKLPMKVPVRQSRVSQSDEQTYFDGWAELDSVGEVMEMPETAWPAHRNLTTIPLGAADKSLYVFPAFWRFEVMLAAERESGARGAFEELKLAFF